MTDERQPGETRTYLISDVAALTGVSDHTLRAWETLGLLAPCRSTRGVRQYTEDDLARVRLIIRTLRKPKHSRRVVASMLRSGELRPDAADYAPGAAPLPRRRTSSAISAPAPPDEAARARGLTHILSALARVSAAVASGRPLREVLDVLCKETCAAFGVPDAVLWLTEAADQEHTTQGEHWLTIAAGAGPHAEAALRAPAPPASAFSIARMPIVHAMRTHRPEVIHLRDASPEVYPEIGALLPAAALLVAPLFSQQGRALGVLALREAFNANRFDDDDREYARLFASQAALALESARLQDALRAARDEAERERSRWRAAVDDLPELVCLCDADLRFTYASPAHQRLIKRPPDPTLSPEEWPAHYGHFVPETGELFPAQELVFPRVLRERAPVKDIEILHRGEDGEKHLIVWAGAPMYTPDGTLLGAVAIGHDITEQRRLERELAARVR
ncbi:MAG TPA: GAF domain-containing protein, partial [Ktedonobacterales bacterium]